MIRIVTVVVQQASFPIRVSKGLRRRWSRVLPLFGCALVVLAGCASRPPPAPVPPPRYAAAARLIPPDGVLTLRDGAAMPVRIWQAQGQERAVVLALHGFNDSRDAWEYSAPTLAGQGITLIAPDIRGFGGAPMRGGWAGATQLVADAREEIAQIRRDHPGVPLYLMGESMGGSVLMLLMAGPDAPSVAGTILLAPAVWDLGGGADIPLDILATFFPQYLVTGRELPVHVVASDNPAALIRLYYNPLTLRQTRLEALRGLVMLMRRAARVGADLHGPVLCLYGDQDQLVPPQAMVRVWQEVPPNVRLDLITGGHHLLLRDRRGALALNDIASWITQPERFLPSGGDVASAVWLAQHSGARGLGHNDPAWFLPARLDGAAPP
ncbi:alpha/beta fold hydrolase [Acetobacter lambici]|uniref:Lysophospholipase n=1 Tax=Acetobacter lambici TaxID=1332824 RepID=A0ABT1F0K7_9PROT|nr:alpha/beta fold hydrolase [Acetobacter lambici]MCP1243225.1 lysophospholipase [Acetobacter lambici]MCP1258511.1 lysophospholipase [Acetobacter lambici]NHO57213.1 alpha/beta fold hydrolase [Acetobacter lambici]